MKIAKGHYVPKELITSEAVHEAVVKCFVAAGFERLGISGYGTDIGVGEIGVGVRYEGGCMEQSLTLQQLFTAENGLQWPTSAYRVVASATGVWFDLSRLPPVVISGVYSGGIDARVLAIRQPKEKDHIVEANEMVSETSESKCEAVAVIDSVKNPKHYQVIEGVESITIIASAMTVDQWRGFCLGNILKYRIRAGKKGDLQQDIAKADYYQELYEMHKNLCRDAK